MDTIWKIERWLDNGYVLEMAYQAKMGGYGASRDVKEIEQPHFVNTEDGWEQAIRFRHISDFDTFNDDVLEDMSMRLDTDSMGDDNE